MRSAAVDTSSNRLLASLPDPVRRRLARVLEPARLARGEKLIEVGRRVEHVYFPGRRTVILLERPSEETEGIGMCLVGREGLVGADAALGNGRATYRAVSAFEGEAMRLRMEAFRAEANRARELMDRVLRHSQFLLHFAAQVALCHRFHRLDRHLGSWILSLQDLAESRELPITHDFLARNLGVRRVGVTQAAGRLRAARLIGYRWGKLKVLFRKRLMDFACVCYRRVCEARHRILDSAPAGK
jgi:CRP-like cAMP-binding protein